MSPFITFRDKDEDGKLQYFILQRDFPHFVGIIREYPSTGNWCSAVAGHNLWVTFSETLRGNVVPSYKNISDEIQSVMDNMAAWFHAERIVLNEGKFKKFKIK